MAGPQSDGLHRQVGRHQLRHAGRCICLRRLDEDLTYPDDLDGRVHHDGTIWSQALCRSCGTPRQVKADTAILMAQFDWTGTDMPDLAERIVDAVNDLYGGVQADAAQAAFEERGIL